MNRFTVLESQNRLSTSCMVWLFAATAPEEGGEGRGREAKRQELAPIAIVNPLLAHRDILGLGSHKKVGKKLKLKPEEKE